MTSLLMDVLQDELFLCVLNGLSVVDLMRACATARRFRAVAGEIMRAQRLAEPQLLPEATDADPTSRLSATPW